MLEAIADFWKPVKKAAAPQKLKPADMQIGSVVGFGYVPQAALSGRKLTVTAINTYQFGADTLTSFVLTAENGTTVSMIVAEAQGEQYLAISRRITETERAKLFDTGSIEEIISEKDVAKFSCKDNVPELKGWLVASYKREIQGMRGFLHNADFRNGNSGSHAGKEFHYTLLGSNSNEHAIEIEGYEGGKIDVYATVYRRISDVTEISAAAAANSEVKAQQIPVLDSVDASVEKKEGVTEEPKIEEKTAAVENKPEKQELSDTSLVSIATSEGVKLESAISESPAPVKLKEENLPEFTANIPQAEVKTETIKVEEVKAEENNNNNNNHNEKESEKMTINVVAGTEVKLPNGQAGELATKELANGTIKAGCVGGESIDCELRVANQIIEEAIRNEMRLSDVVRRIVELPVAHQELVQLPLNLADEDYSLLAIRYGIPASDRSAIKTRIIQELVDFSGSKKKAA